MFEVSILAAAMNAIPPKIKKSEPKPVHMVADEEIELVADENILVQI